MYIFGKVNLRKSNQRWYRVFGLSVWGLQFGLRVRNLFSVLGLIDKIA